MKNYLKIKRFSLFYYHYAFLDASEHMADQLFIQHKINVKFGPEMTRDDIPYRIIFCKIRKKDKEKFLKSLEKMYDKAILLGYLDYDKYSKELIENYSDTLS